MVEILWKDIFPAFQYLFTAREDAQKDIDGLKNQLANSNSAIGVAQNEIARLKTTIDGYEQELSSAKAAQKDSASTIEQQQLELDKVPDIGDQARSTIQNLTSQLEFQRRTLADYLVYMNAGIDNVKLQALKVHQGLKAEMKRDLQKQHEEEQAELTTAHNDRLQEVWSLCDMLAKQVKDLKHERWEYKLKAVSLTSLCTRPSYGDRLMNSAR